MFIKGTKMLVILFHTRFVRKELLIVVLLLMLILRGSQLWEQKRDILQEWRELSLLGVLGMGVCGAFVYIGAETTEATNIGLL